MSTYFQNEKIYYFIVLLLACVLCFVNLGGHPIYILDEAKNAEAAREMLLNQDWITPTFNGELRTDKPPLHYWFMKVSYEIFGVNAFSARFFSAVFGVLTILSTFHYTRKFMGLKMGLMAAFVFLSAIFFVQEFHLAVPDPYLIFFVSFGLFQFFDFYRYRKKLAWFLFYSSLGLGILAKGPVAIALPGISIFIFLVMNKDFNWKSVLAINPFLGLILSFAIAAPWYYLVHQATHGAYTEGFFFEHNFQRFSGEMEGHGGLPFVTWAFVLLGLLPFSFFIIQGLVQGWKKRKTDEYLLFSWVIAVVFIMFFSISQTKLPNYPMPSYPFIVVLIGFYLAQLLEGNLPLKGYKISLWVWLVISILMPIGGFIAFTLAEKQLEPVRFVSLSLIVLPIGSILAMIFLKRNQLKQSLASIGISSMIMTILLFSWVYPNLLTQSPLVMAKGILDSNSKTIVYKGYDPAFLFNFERNLPIADTKEEVLKFLAENPTGNVITKEKFIEQDWQDFPMEIQLKQKAIFENYTIVIFKPK